jgi:hypothetical protein
MKKTDEQPETTVFRQFDFSKFNEYLNDGMNPKDLVNCLEELRAEYLELSIHVAYQWNNIEVFKRLPHQNVPTHSNLLGKLINLIRGME